MYKVLLFFISSLAVIAKPHDVTRTKNPNNPPPRIIRPCCSFGADVKMAGLSFIKITDITSVEKIGPHKYLGQDEENNGIVYTRKGGFIDLGHLRDQADWTSYLFTQIQNHPNGTFTLPLGKEGGPKIVDFHFPKDLSKEEKVLLAGRIAYDLSLWHEIATSFGTSYIPFVPERYSSFSIEDAYSNYLGVVIGMKAILSEDDYEHAMTTMLDDWLTKLEVVKTAKETYDAMEMSKGDWWTDEAKLPSKNVLLKREFDVENCLKPWLVNKGPYLGEKGYELCVMHTTEAGIPLDDFYDLKIHLNAKFAIRKIEGLEAKEITQKDFGLLIKQASTKIFSTEEVPAYLRKRRNSIRPTNAVSK